MKIAKKKCLRLTQNSYTLFLKSKNSYFSFSAKKFTNNFY